MMAVAVVLGVAGFAAAQFVRTSRVEANDTDRWTVRAPSGSSRVVVDGDGDTDLDCFVYDRNGRLLGKDDDYTDYSSSTSTSRAAAICGSSSRTWGMCGTSTPSASDNRGLDQAEEVQYKEKGRRPVRASAFLSCEPGALPRIRPRRRGACPR